MSSVLRTRKMSAGVKSLSFATRIFIFENSPTKSRFQPEANG